MISADLRLDFPSIYWDTGEICTEPLNRRAKWKFSASSLGLCPAGPCHFNNLHQAKVKWCRCKDGRCKFSPEWPEACSASCCRVTIEEQTSWPKIFCLVQGSVNFFWKGQIVNNWGFTDHRISDMFNSTIISQRQQPYAKFKHISIVVVHQSFIQAVGVAHWFCKHKSLDSILSSPI